MGGDFVSIKERRIGFFDSGVGGLSVLKEGIREFAKEDFVYIGDTLHMPYGEKSPQQVEQFTENCLRFLEKKNVKAAVIACNTATCYGLNHAQNIFEFPVLGVVEPACNYAAEVTKNKKVALVATQGTVDSGVYEKMLAKIDPLIDFRAVGCPDLVLAIEDGHLHDNYVRSVVENYLQKFFNFDYDTIILGCTHFPLVQSTFEVIFKEQRKSVQIVDPAYRSVLALRKILEEQNLLNDKGQGQVNYYVTSNLNRFQKTVQEVMKQERGKNTFELVED